MPLISTTVPNLISGVSQQADSLRFPSQSVEQVNGNSSVLEGLTKRPNTQHISRIVSGTVGDTLIHTINRDTSNRFIVLFRNDTIQVFDTSGTSKTVTFSSDGYSSGDAADYIDTSTPTDDLRVVSVADYTFVVNTSKTTAIDSAVTADRGKEAIVFIKQTASSATHYIELDGTTVSTTSNTSTEAAASALNSSLVSTFDSATYDFEVKGSIIWIKRDDGEDFEISVRDTVGTTYTGLAKDTIVNFVELPTSAPHGFTVKVAGDPEIIADDYYVKFVAKDEDFSEGEWQEAVGPGLTYKFDATSMPHALVHDIGADTFEFKALTWDERAAGDDSSNPAPSFVGYKINDLFLHKNRLGVLSDEAVIFSESAEFFNFWRTTVTSLLDSAPIDVLASHNKVSILYNAVPYFDQLVLFGDQTQFSIKLPDANLTPSTVSIQQATEFENLKGVRPLHSGKNLYFPFKQGAYSGVMEYFASPDTLQLAGNDVTGNVSKYIAGDIKELGASETERIIVARSSGLTNGLYVYKFFYSGLEKLQSAWSKWTFGDNAEIKGFSFIESDLYILIYRADDGLCLEKISVEEGLKDTSSDYTIYLDRRVAEEDTGVTVAYDSSADTTTWTLPYSVDTSADTMNAVARFDEVTFQFVQLDQEDGENIICENGDNLGYGLDYVAGGTEFTVTETTSNTLSVSGDYANQPMWLGQQYAFEYTMNKPMLREQKSQGKILVAGGRYQIRSGTLVYDNTRDFSVESTPSGRDTSTTAFSSTTLEDGTHRFYVMCKNDKVSIVIKSTKPFPLALLSLDWEGVYENRAVRY